MIERLAIPAWNAPATTLDAWLAAFRGQLHEARRVRDADMTWIEVPSLRMRGYVMVEGEGIEAIHFEIQDRQAPESFTLLDAVAASLQWEIHDETDDDEP